MTGYTPPFFLEQFVDHAGNPLSGGSLTFLVAGSTSLPKNIYLDYALTNIAPNPFPLSADGFAPQYFMEAGLYKVIIKDSTGSIIATRDYIEGSGGGAFVEDSYKVKSTNADPTPDYLTNKLIGGSSIQIGYVTLPNNTIKTTITDDGRIPASSTDSTIEYLDQKIINSPSITWETTGSTTKKLSAKVNPLYGSVLPVWCILSAGITTPPFGLSPDDIYSIYSQHYGVAGVDLTDGSSGLAIWYLEGGTYSGDATWVKLDVEADQLILNANYGLYDYMHKLPEDTQNGDSYSNYPAGLYVCQRSSDWSEWIALVVKNYPDPEFSTDSVLTYNGYTKEFVWVASDAYTGSGAVRIDDQDFTPRFLGYKVQAGSGITIDDVYNGSYGRFLRVNSTGSNPSGRTYASTMYIANAVQTLAPNLIVRSELITLFVPTTDIKVIQGISSKFGCFLSQGGTGTMSFTLRDEQYRLIAQSYDTTNPLPQVFLELNCGIVYDPATGLSVPNYTLECGGRYYLGILWNANGIQLLGDDAVQNNNTQPYTAYKVDNLLSSTALAQLSGGGESKQRPFIRLLTGT